jgi:hypothetical protein
MPNRKILICQKRYYMKLRNLGERQIESAFKSDISVRTARRIDKSGASTILPKLNKRSWKTRKDPLLDIWESELKPLLEISPNLQPITLFEYLEDKYPGKYQNNILRTLQRRIKDFKILSGDNKEVMFLQKHHPAQMGISDFTVFNGEVTINGTLFNHRFYHYRLVYSKWAHVEVIQGGESWTALANSFQNALQKSGGSPNEHRTDSLSAAYNNNSEKKTFTKSYQEFCDHYDILPSRNNLGKSHENGSIESPNGHLKNKIRQNLIIRGSNDFASIDQYQQFIGKIVNKHNLRNSKLFEEEKKLLKNLPNHKIADFSILHVKVTSCSTINIKNITYSVPANLVGQKIVIHLFDSRLEIFYGNNQICTLIRIYNKDRNKRKSSINYRHIISSLVQKPQAFKNFIWKEELFPNDDYKQIWQISKMSNDSKTACKYFVKLLYLAYKLSENKESKISDYVLQYYRKNNKLPTIEYSENHFGINNNNRSKEVISKITTNQHDLNNYNQLLQINQFYSRSSH